MRTIDIEIVLSNKIELEKIIIEKEKLTNYEIKFLETIQRKGFYEL